MGFKLVEIDLEPGEYARGATVGLVEQAEQQVANADGVVEALVGDVDGALDR